MLRSEHVAQFVFESLGVVAAVEVAVVFTPRTPTAGETVEHLARVALAAEHGLARFIEQGLACPVHLGACLVHLGHSRLAEVLLRHDVDGDLAPVGRRVDVARFEYERTVGVADLGVPLREWDAFVGRLALDREPPADLHVCVPPDCGRREADRS